MTDDDDDKVLKKKRKYLDSAVEHLVKDVRPSFHDFDVMLSRVGVLAVGDWVHETIQVLVVLPQQIRFYELHHAIVCKKYTAHETWYGCQLCLIMIN